MNKEGSYVTQIVVETAMVESLVDAGHRNWSFDSGIVVRKLVGVGQGNKLRAQYLTILHSGAKHLQDILPSQ